MSPARAHRPSARAGTEAGTILAAPPGTAISVPGADPARNLPSRQESCQREKIPMEPEARARAAQAAAAAAADFAEKAAPTYRVLANLRQRKFAVWFLSFFAALGIGLQDWIHGDGEQLGACLVTAGAVSVAFLAAQGAVDVADRLLVSRELTRESPLSARETEGDAR